MPPYFFLLIKKVPKKSRPDGFFDAQKTPKI
ncbi:MAG: hypothetical protein ACI94Y_003188, partial [Maribacter sp.]